MRSYSVHTRRANGQGGWMFTGVFHARNQAEARAKATEMLSEEHRALFEVRVTHHPKRKNACGNP